jgi:regulator of sigma E protease
VSFLLAFVGFAALVVLHELGHFAAAKAVGMRVEKFSLFFGPFLAKFTRGETTYGIGPIPLGGYVKITGMNPAEEIAPEHAHRAYYRQPVWKRIVVIVAGPLVNIVLAFLILWVLLANTSQLGDTTSTVEQAQPGSPAAEVLSPGDRIVAVDGRRGGVETLAKTISSHRCAGPPQEGCRAATPARVTVERDGREQTFSVTPVYSAEAKRTLIGIGFAREELPSFGAGRAANESLDRMWFVTEASFKVLGQLYKPEQREQLSGVVGSYETTRQFIEIDYVQAIFILALISLSLGVINLLPFLPLDGGHIFWAVAEKLRGRPIPFRVMERASVVGIALVGILFFIGLQNDIGRLTGEGFGVR